MSEKGGIKAKKRAEEDDEDKIRMYASLSFIVVILVVGLPMWWKTTEVYRVPLPYSDIEQLSSVPIITLSTVYIYSSDSSRSRLLISELTESFSVNRKTHVLFKEIKLGSLPAHIKTPNTLEKLILESVSIKAGEFVFIEWQALTDDVLVTAGRSAFISPMTSAKKIELVLRNWIFQEHKLKVVSSAVKTFAELKNSRSTGEAIQPFTDVVLTVINPNADLQTVDWDVYSAAKDYLEVFLKEVEVLSTFNVKTQWKFEVAINQQPQQVQDNSRLGRHYSLGEEYLTHFVTTLEKSVGQGISTNPNIQLVVYVPPCQVAPLVIYKKNGERASNKSQINTFLSPKWGGVIISNPPEEMCKNILENNAATEAVVSINSHEVMTVVLHLVRKLLDIDVDIPISGASIVELDHLAPRDWELDAYTRIGIVNLLNSVTITLSSLKNLLNDINYIVINDKVGHAIQEANKNIQVAKELLKKNELIEASKFAKEAFKYSELAFFDPSLLALLYFPDEQKYAIYIPLFLPIMIPVLMSLNSFLKNFKAKRDAKKTKAD